MTDPGDRAAVERVLDERARALAARRTDERREALVSVVAVRAGGQLFGLPLAALAEVVPMRPIAHLAALPPWLPGLVQVRGELVSVLDLAHWFQVPGTPSPRSLALVSHQRRLLALLVDEVLGARVVFTDEVAAELLRDHEARARPVQAVTRDLLLVLDAERLFSHPDVVVDGGA